MKPAPKPAKKRKGPRGKIPIRWAFWRMRSKECRERDGNRCAAGYAGTRCPGAATQAAHKHGLGMGRSRNKPDAKCSQCGTRLNDLDNLVAVCSEACNNSVAIKCPGRGEQCPGK